MQKFLHLSTLNAADPLPALGKTVRAAVPAAVAHAHAWAPLPDSKAHSRCSCGAVTLTELVAPRTAVMAGGAAQDDDQGHDWTTEYLKHLQGGLGVTWFSVDPAAACGDSTGITCVSPQDFYVNCDAHRLNQKIIDDLERLTGMPASVIANGGGRNYTATEVAFRCADAMIKIQAGNSRHDALVRALRSSSGAGLIGFI